MEEVFMTGGEDSLCDCCIVGAGVSIGFSLVGRDVDCGVGVGLGDLAAGTTELEERGRGASRVSGELEQQESFLVNLFHKWTARRGPLGID